MGNKRVSISVDGTLEGGGVCPIRSDGGQDASTQLLFLCLTSILYSHSASLLMSTFASTSRSAARYNVYAVGG